MPEPANDSLEIKGLARAAERRGRCLIHSPGPESNQYFDKSPPRSACRSTHRRRRSLGALVKNASMGALLAALLIPLQLMLAGGAWAPPEPAASAAVAGTVA